MPSYQNDPVISRTTTPSGTENYNGGIYGESLSTGQKLAKWEQERGS